MIQHLIQTIKKWFIIDIHGSSKERQPVDFLLILIVISLNFELEFGKSTHLFKDVDGQNKSWWYGLFIFSLDYFVSHVSQHLNGAGAHRKR